jgi:hypothetical protein
MSRLACSGVLALAVTLSTTGQESKLIDCRGESLVGPGWPDLTKALLHEIDVPIASRAASSNAGDC